MPSGRSSSRIVGSLGDNGVLYVLRCSSAGNQHFVMDKVSGEFIGRHLEEAKENDIITGGARVKRRRTNQATYGSRSLEAWNAVRRKENNRDV